MGNKSVKYRSDTVAEANLKRGDLIKINRSSSSGLRGFYHYAVYAGDNKVIHLTKGKAREFCKCPDDVTYVEGNTASVCKHCGKSYRFAVVSEDLKAVLKQSEFRVANNRDTSDGPLPENQIVAKARSLLGPVNYSLSRYNCEHFANWCRYGVAVSVQSLIRWFNVNKYTQKVKKAWKNRSIKQQNTL